MWCDDGGKVESSFRDPLVREKEGERKAIGNREDYSENSSKKAYFREEKVPLGGRKSTMKL